MKYEYSKGNVKGLINDYFYYEPGDRTNPKATLRKYTTDLILSILQNGKTKTN